MIFNQNNSKLLISLLIFLGVVTFSCKSNSERTADLFWKYHHGFRIGDFINVDGSLYSISNDTIYKNDSAVATIIDVKWRISFDNILSIKSISEDQMGYYVSKGRRRQ